MVRRRFADIPVNWPAVALTVTFAVVAVLLLVALRGYYAQGFSLLVGWVVLYVLGLAWLKSRRERNARRSDEAASGPDEGRDGTDR